MPIDPRQMVALLDRERGVSAHFSDTSDPAGLAEAPAPKPTPGEVLYTPPNRDGSRKECSNCFAYATQARRCYIHAPDLQIAPDAVCGYHVFTPSPLPVFRDVLPLEPVTPNLSGLERVPGGTSCDLCHYYAPVDQDGGACGAVSDEFGVPAQVQPLGCCSRWSPK